jgi:hypothetical protein
MMDHTDMERRLKMASPDTPSQLRARVLDAVSDELGLMPGRNNGAWFAGLAAALLIGMNLAMIAGEQLELSPAIAVTDPADLTPAVCQALPELTGPEVRGLALSLSLRSTVGFVPIAEPRPNHRPGSTFGKETPNGTPAALD